MKQGRKISGGKYKKQRKKKLYEQTRQERAVSLGEKRTKKIRTKGGGYKTVLLSENKANLITGKKAEKAEIKNVIETPSNRFLARQNILVKSAIIDTSLGKARITNSPGQEGKVEAVLIKE